MVSSKNENKKIINNITTILLCIIIIIASLIVGTPLKENTFIITKISFIVFIIYMVLYKLILKKKYKDLITHFNKIDVCVILLCISSLIPIIYDTSVNILDSKNTAIRYITLLIIYFLSRILLIQENKYKNFFEKTLIITGIISAIIGIDNMTLGILSEQLEKIGNINFINSENRMFANFGYANTFAISMLLPFILCIEEYLKNNKLKIVYLFTAFLLLSCFILSYSRASYITLIILLLLYLIFNKKSEKNIKFITSIFLLICGAILYSKIFIDYYSLNIYIIISALIVIGIITCTTISTINKKIDYKKISVKKYVKYIVFFVILLGTFIFLGLHLDKPLKLFENSNESIPVTYMIKNIEPNKEYVLEFDVTSRTINNEAIYNILVSERNKSDNQTNVYQIRFGTHNGIKRLTFTTKENTKNFVITFKTLNHLYQRGLEIKNLTINGKKYKLDYVYLPVTIVNRIESLSISSILNHGRIIFYKDAFKIIEKNPWTGVGGNCWKHVYKDVRSYNYSTNQVHSYPVQILLEFGLLSIISYALMVIFILLNIKNYKENIYSILIAFIGIVIHSTIDFDLSFMNMLIYTIILISILSTNSKKIFYKKDRFLNSFFKRSIDIIGSVVGIILLIPITIVISIAKIFYKDKGPIFYTQNRIGKNGKIFKLYKFRSMVVNADEILQECLNKNKALKKEYTECKKMIDDPRVTKIGKYIRKTNIDEIPQFINVLKGEMSIVGPRPYLIREKKDIEKYYDELITCKPGITGKWQVYKGNDNRFSTRIKLDIEYIKKNNILFDIKIMIKTLEITIKRKNK